MSALVKITMVYAVKRKIYSRKLIISIHVKYTRAGKVSNLCIVYELLLFGKNK